MIQQIRVPSVVQSNSGQNNYCCAELRQRGLPQKTTMSETFLSGQSSEDLLADFESLLSSGTIDLSAEHQIVIISTPSTVDLHPAAPHPAEGDILLFATPHTTPGPGQETRRPTLGRPPVLPLLPLIIYRTIYNIVIIKTIILPLLFLIYRTNKTIIITAIIMLIMPLLLLIYRTISNIIIIILIILMLNVNVLMLQLLVSLLLVILPLLVVIIVVVFVVIMALVVILLLITSTNIIIET